MFSGLSGSHKDLHLSVSIMLGASFREPKHYAAFLFGALALLILARYRSRRGSTLPLPPGPPRLPIIGNLHQMPSTHLWEKAVEWGKQYGDLVYVENVGIPTLILNSFEAVSELLVKRSAIYSSRPHITMFSELLDLGWTTTILPYGETLRKHRTHLHKFFQTSETLNYLEIQERNCYVMLNGLLNAPKGYAEHIRRLPSAVILRNVYGYEAQGEDDPIVHLGENVVRTGGEALTYLFLNFVPWLKYLPEGLPGIAFPGKAREGRQYQKTFRATPYEIAKRNFIEGTGKECMTSVLFAESLQEDGSFNDEQTISGAAGTAFLGGTDTSATAILTFVLAILKNPDKQRRAQEEIDTVIGSNRLPNHSDMDSLPYVRAICTEILRWEVILPFAVPHLLTEDDEYMGHSIPAGTWVFPNVWAISRDPKHYPDPLSFKPERWIPGETKEGVPPLRPQEICPGQNWAEHIIFLAVASLLATFNIEPDVGPDGTQIPPNDQFIPSAIRTLRASKCRITPRSDKAASLIRQAVSSL
ncbi:CyP450 monooxygenase [Schizopora paradoxa]|uniref:CyP450 monooxygenase n=1 Tax=Schizopora paradoxa TaxID=27342 RepID=A0A0H2RS74_9AGAM|nr:CyP450 monooxygenase [Schizopora paradoxa]